MPDPHTGEQPGTGKTTIKKIFQMLLVLLGVLIILSLLTPSHGPRERGRRVMCMNNLEQIGMAMKFYADDHDDIRPATLPECTRYVGGDQNCRIFMCPTAVRGLKSEPPKRISQFKDHLDYMSYDLLSATGLVEGPVNAAVAPVMCDRPGNHGGEGMSLLFADGHVTWWPGTLSDYARSNALAITIIPLGLE